MGFTASQGQDKRSHFLFFSSPLQQMVKRKSLSAGGRMHQGQGLSFEVHSKPGRFDRTVLHTLTLIKCMRKKKVGFAKHLDTEILIRLGILQNSRLEPHGPVWQQEHAATKRDSKIFSPHWLEKGGGDEGVNIDIPEVLILLKPHRLILYDERQSAVKGKKELSCTENQLVYLFMLWLNWSEDNDTWLDSKMKESLLNESQYWKYWGTQNYFIVMSTATKQGLAEKKNMFPAQLYCS